MSDRASLTSDLTRNPALSARQASNQSPTRQMLGVMESPRKNAASPVRPGSSRKVRQLRQMANSPNSHSSVSSLSDEGSNITVVRKSFLLTRSTSEESTKEENNSTCA